MSIKRSIVIGQPKETQGADQEEKKTSKKSVASVKKGTLERTAPVGIVHDKTVLKSVTPPAQRKPRVYKPEGKTLVIVESPA